MKTKFKVMSVLALVGLVLFGVTAPVSAQSFQSASFLTGANLLVNGGSTNTYGTTNTWLQYSGIYGAAYVLTNTSVNMTNTRAMQDVDLWADRDGTSPAANISVTLQGLNTNATNKVDFLFYSIPRGRGGYAATTSQNSFQFTATANGTNLVTVATNIPTAWLQGCGAVRFYSATSIGMISGTNVYVKELALNGFRQ